MKNIEYFINYKNKNILNFCNAKKCNEKGFREKKCKIKMNGKGIFEWNDGKKYDGNFVKDKKEGFGILTWPDGRVYEGEWKNGKQHGKGSYINRDGEKIEG